MTLVNLSNNERAATGYTHAAHFSVADGDLATQGNTDIIALSANYVIDKAAFLVITAWSGGTSPAIDVGPAATTSTDDTLIDGQTLATTGTIVSGTGTNALVSVPCDASDYLTIRQTGTGTNTAGEGILFFSAIDLSVQDNFVA